MAKTLFKPVSYELSQLLGDIDLGKLALPELQRPFVWKKAAVRDLLDSMYRGFPVGYLMLWNAAEVDAKLIGVDGKQHTPTEFIVDGQQRLTGLYAVMKGAEITFKDFSRGRINIAFRPRDGQFDVTDAAIEKDPEFLPNITQLWTGEDWEVIEAFIERLRAAKPEALQDGCEKQLRTALSRLSGLEDFPFLAVQIGHEVDEERVAEIFLRVNSGGTMLTQADFILTLLSVFREEDRRRLERFAQAVRIVPGDATPSPYNHLVQPAADQLLRVAVLVAFQRGRLQSVLALLRGGSLDGDETLLEGDREVQPDKLTAAIDVILDLTSWHEYIKTLMSAGFRRSNEISSENNVVLVYALYLIGRGYGLSHSDLRTTIARYFFMSSLTGRYTGSFEAQITQDVQAFTLAADGADYLERLRRTISTTLTSDYWTITLPLGLATSAAQGPGLFAYGASLCLLNARVPRSSKRAPITSRRRPSLFVICSIPSCGRRSRPSSATTSSRASTSKARAFAARQTSTRSPTCLTSSGPRTSRSPIRPHRSTGRGMQLSSRPTTSSTTHYPTAGRTWATRSFCASAASSWRRSSGTDSRRSALRRPSQSQLRVQRSCPIQSSTPTCIPTDRSRTTSRFDGSSDNSAETSCGMSSIWIARRSKSSPTSSPSVRSTRYACCRGPRTCRARPRRRSSASQPEARRLMRMARTAAGASPGTSRARRRRRPPDVRGPAAQLCAGRYGRLDPGVGDADGHLRGCLGGRGPSASAVRAGVIALTLEGSPGGRPSSHGVPFKVPF